MVEELLKWFDAQNIDYKVIDDEVVDIPNFGKMFLADLSGVETIFKGKDDNLQFNLMENPDVLQEEGIFFVAFPFGNNWYYYDLREEFRFNILKHIGRPKPTKHNILFVNLGVHTPYELLNAANLISLVIIDSVIVEFLFAADEHFKPKMYIPMSPSDIEEWKEKHQAELSATTEEEESETNADTEEKDE